MLRSLFLAALLIAAPAAAQPKFLPEALPAPPQPGAVVLSVPAGTPDREVWYHEIAADGTNWGVRNITVPTLVPVLPVGGHTGAAMIVAPGGGFLGLAIEDEGWDVARWFANRGITAFVLKYRVVPTPVNQPTFVAELARAMAGGQSRFRPPGNTPPEALADGLAALRWVRSHAGQFGIDPKRIGFMGFSAGGFLTRSVIEHGGSDAPDFAAAIYPNMTAMTVSAGAPPLFVAIAADDFLVKDQPGLQLIDSYRAAGAPIEFHLLSGGGHAFGLGRAGQPSEGWPDMLHRWMRSIGVLEARREQAPQPK